MSDKILFPKMYGYDWTTPEKKAVKGLLGYFISATITWHQIHPHKHGLKKTNSIVFLRHL